MIMDPVAERCDSLTGRYLKILITLNFNNFFSRKYFNIILHVTINHLNNS